MTVSSILSPVYHYADDQHLKFQECRICGEAWTGSVYQFIMIKLCPALTPGLVGLYTTLNRQPKHTGCCIHQDLVLELASLPFIGAFLLDATAKQHICSSSCLRKTEDIYTGEHAAAEHPLSPPPVWCMLINCPVVIYSERRDVE